MEVSTGGGSVIYVKNTFSASAISSFNAPDSLAVLVNTPIGNIKIACVYRSDSLNKTQDRLLLSSLKHLCTVDPSSEMIMVGDFNMKDVSWITGNVTGPVDGSSISNEYMNMITESGLNWHITDQITRRRLVQGVLQESTLDQVFCSNDALINKVNITSPIGRTDHKKGSDHMCIIVEVNVNVDEQQKYIETSKQNWSKISQDDLLKKSFDVNWSYTNQNLSSQDMWEELHGKLMNIASEVPTSDVKVSPSGEPYKKPWSCSALQRKLRQRDKQWAIFDTDPTPANLNIALSYQNEYERLETKSKIKYERKITKNLKKSSKSFFSYLRNKRKIKTTVTALSRPDGSKTEGPLDTANLLAESFSSVFLTEPQGPLPEQCTQLKDGIYNIHDVDICDSDVKNKLCTLNIYKSFGPDECHPKLLKAMADNPQFVEALGDLLGVVLLRERSLWSGKRLM